MSSQNINGYAIERFVIGDDDYFDIDWFDTSDSTYKTAKVKGSVLKALISNIYTSDGVLTGDRILDADLNALLFDNLRKFTINVNPAPFGANGVEFNVNPSGRLFTITDSSTGIRKFGVNQDGSVTFNQEYTFPLVDGSAGQVLATDGAGQLSFVSSSGVNIYNADGTLTANRTLTGSNFVLLFQTMGQFIVESHQNNVDNIIFEVRSDATYHGFIVRDHNTGVHMIACRNGQVEISDAYFLPSTDGSSGQFLVTNGSGVVSWQSQTWQPPHLNILDGLASGGLTSANNSGAGFNRYFNGTGTAGRLSFNIGLNRRGVLYDGTSFKLRIQYQIFGANTGGNVSWQIEHKFVNANGTTNAENSPTTTNVLMNVAGQTSNVLYEFDLITFSGAVGSDVLMLNVIRLTTGTNTNIIDAISFDLIK